MSVSSGQPIVVKFSTNPLILCINSLDRTNEKEDECIVSNLLDDSTPENSTQEQITQILHRLYEQRRKINDIYNREIDLCEVTEKLTRFLDQIDVVLEQYDQDQSNLDSFNLMVASNQSFDEDTYAEYFKDITDSDEVDVSDLLAESIEDETTPNESNDHSYSRSTRYDENLLQKSTINQLKRFRYDKCCPLTSRSYGLDAVKHGIRHFPCTRLTAPINLYKHLIQYHHLTHSPAMQIVRLIADQKNENDIDLFSKQSNSLIATHPTIYRAQCPLNEYGKFGITSEHKIRLCTQPNQTLGTPHTSPKDVCLYDHFVIYHQMKRSCAQRLAEAIVRNKTGAIFRPNEQILNETFYIQCPLRHPQAICWNTPIATRHMGQHLTGIHKLDRNEHMLTTNHHECEKKKFVEDDDDENEIDDNDDDDDEQVNILEPVQGLFSNDIYPNVIEMFRSYQPDFHLIEFLQKHQITSQYDYIRLINYIRREKPSMEDLKTLKTTPWTNEEYFQTVIENDPALQFDIEEDLNQLGSLTLSDTTVDVDPLKKANERIRQLEEIVGTLRSMTSRLLDEQSAVPKEKVTTVSEEQDNDYFATYNHYEIHKDMLQDTVRTESYLNAIKKNVDLFRDKIVLDVGCGTGILSMACLQYGQAKLVIAVDMSDMIYDAMAIAKENNIDESKIVFLHGRIEDVTLPVDKVDIIISEWMGYFLLFECMLESIIFARNHYLTSDNGLVLPDDFSIDLSAFHSERLYHENVGFWSNVYGFEMNTVVKNILADGHVMLVPAEDLMSDACCIKNLNIYTCSNDDIAFTHPFTIHVSKTGSISGFVCSFDVGFSKNLIEKVYFSTSSNSTATHWKQTVFFLPRLYPVQQGEEVNGKIVCQRHPKEKRGLLISLHVFDSKFKFFLE